MKVIKTFTVILTLLSLAACGQNETQNKLPQAAILTDETIGHSDKMIVVNHDGPRTQIFLRGTEKPLWFSSVRDGLVYLKSSEQTAPILVSYVNDVGLAKDWKNMGKGNWINADNAYFVVGSNAVGGMGAPEFVPFADKKKALEFIKQKGGKVLRITEINAEMVLTPIMQMQELNSD